MIVVPQTEVRLLSNVPLLNSYEHQMTFDSKASQTSYFYNKESHAFNDFTYVKEDGTIKVPKGRDSLYACNYVMWKNTDFTTKWFYGFITSLEYVNPNTTKVHFELDVFQTWQFDFEFKPSYVAREHTPRWNADGSPVINTIDEGLDYGTEYDTVSVENIRPNNGYKWFVVIAKESIHGTTKELAPGIVGTPQPLTYYVTPFKNEGITPTVILEDGTSVPISPPAQVLKNLYLSEDATNNIVSIYVTDYIGVNIGVTEGSPDVLTFPPDGGVDITQAVFDGIYTLVVNEVKEFEPHDIQVNANKYEGFNNVTESKLLMYPYTVTVLDDFKGNRVELKNEHITSQELRLTLKGSLGLSNKTSWGVGDYNYRDFEFYNEMANENALINNNPTDVPIVTDMLSAYLQGNRNSLEAQRNAIIWNGTLGGSGALIGGIGGGMVGGPVGAVVGAGAGLTSSIGNTYHQIKAMESKKQDIANTPPQLAKMGSNTAYSVGNQYDGVYVMKKQIKAEYRKRLGDFFKMYGYKVNELKTPNLKSRQHFNFIHTVGANIVGNVPQDDLQVIKRMFDNGVTLWHGDWIGDYSLANGEV